MPAFPDRNGIKFLEADAPQSSVALALREDLVPELYAALNPLNRRAGWPPTVSV